MVLIIPGNSYPSLLSEEDFEKWLDSHYLSVSDYPSWVDTVEMEEGSVTAWRTFLKKHGVNRVYDCSDGTPETLTSEEWILNRLDEYGTG